MKKIIMKHSTTFAFIHYRPYQCKCRDTLHGTDPDFWWDFCWIVSTPPASTVHCGALSNDGRSLQLRRWIKTSQHQVTNRIRQFQFGEEAVFAQPLQIAHLILCSSIRWPAAHFTSGRCNDPGACRSSGFRRMPGSQGRARRNAVASSSDGIFFCLGLGLLGEVRLVRFFLSLYVLYC